MPLPKTPNVGTIMHKLKAEGGRLRKQMVAIAISQARKHGADIPKKPREMAMRARAAGYK